ncbi:MAG: tRNA (uridine(34)/cytosine(34)/5-carboxymethylaminomethyluridine(34)-2'-O)-methyltransferase TrmL [Bacillota bacterium]
MFNIVLVEPEIPQNTGNIARTCAATGASLHLVHPLGFSVDDRSLKRAGLDYWHLLDVHHYDNLEHFLAVHGGKTLWLATTKGSVWHTEVSYRPGDFLLFGKETKGLPAELLAARPHHRIRLPMREDARSLNLSNAVAVVVYEALRQNDFAGLK